MNKNQKIALLVIIILIAAVSFVLLIGKKEAPKTSFQAPAAGQNAPQSATRTDASSLQASAAAPTSQQPALEPLPADDKQAIDAELNNIDKELKTTDNTYKSTDLSNANLGL